MEVANNDSVALRLVVWSDVLLTCLEDVTPQRPNRFALERLMNDPLLDRVASAGLECLGWVVDDRGLGGEARLDGLSWSLLLDRLWEAFVEAYARQHALVTGSEVRVGRLGETTFPLEWSDPSTRSLGHLLPDVVLRRGTTVHVFDAKYKGHLADLDESGWRQFTDDSRESHRADVHQVLAYAALFEATEITATLVYPLSLSTWENLRSRRRDVVRASLTHGGRLVTLELRGLPFGRLPVAMGQ